MKAGGAGGRSLSEVSVARRAAGFVLSSARQQPGLRVGHPLNTVSVS